MKRSNEEKMFPHIRRTTLSLRALRKVGPLSWEGHLEDHEGGIPKSWRDTQPKGDVLIQLWIGSSQCSWSMQSRKGWSNPLAVFPTFPYKGLR